MATALCRLMFANELAWLVDGASTTIQFSERLTRHHTKLDLLGWRWRDDDDGLPVDRTKNSVFVSDTNFRILRDESKDGG